MRIEGQLKNDILRGKAVLFLGAGASQSTGLPNGCELADYLFRLAGEPAELNIFRFDLPRLVAKLDNNPHYSRRWVNDNLINLFVCEKNKLLLEHHKKVFDVRWAGIFTTNYDLCLEYAEHSIKSKTYRLLPIVDPTQQTAIISSKPNVVKYYKMHGCSSELEKHPNAAPPLVLTQSDFRKSIVRNEPFLEELKRLAYDCSIVFVGFEAQRIENNHILANIIETYRILASSFHQSFRAFTVLKDVDEVTKGDIEDAGLTLIQGTFEEFIEVASAIAISSPSDRLRKDISRQIWVKAAGQEIPMTLAQHNQYSSQFACYYEGYLQDVAEEIKS